MDRFSEEQRLSDADHRIARAEATVMEQIAELSKVHGPDARLAERTLCAFTASLEAFKERRRLIAWTIQQMDRS